LGHLTVIDVDVILLVTTRGIADTRFGALVGHIRVTISVHIRICVADLQKWRRIPLKGGRLMVLRKVAPPGGLTTRIVQVVKQLVRRKALVLQTHPWTHEAQK